MPGISFVFSYLCLSRLSKTTNLNTFGTLIIIIKPVSLFCRLRIFSQSTIRRPGPAGGRPWVCGCVGVWVCGCVDKFHFKFSRPFMVRLPSNFLWDFPRVSILRNEEMAPFR